MVFLFQRVLAPIDFEILYLRALAVVLEFYDLSAEIRAYRLSLQI